MGVESEDIMAIFITGDTHGNFKRFENTIFYEQAGLTKRDCVIISLLCRYIPLGVKL